MTFSLRPTYDDPRTAELVEQLRGYLDGELADYERERGFTHASRLTRADLEPVWQRSRELGFYGIHLPDGRHAESACMGFGLERWAYAFLAQKGLDRSRWPARVVAWVDGNGG